MPDTIRDDFHNLRAAFYKYRKGDKYALSPRWRGVTIIKTPADLILYAQAIYEHRPKFIIETGTKFGGSALFLGDMMQLFGGERVFTIDIEQREDITRHPIVEYINSSSVDIGFFRELRRSVSNNGSVMVILDSDHSASHVYRELQLYSQLVTPGQYIVVEDCWGGRSRPKQPYRAVKKFLNGNKRFRRVPVEEQFIFTVSKDGWLLRER